jgi:hypothetical protein
MLRKVVVLIAILLLSQMITRRAEARLLIGDPAPDFTLPDVNGILHSLSDFEGQVVLLNWWATT